MHIRIPLASQIAPPGRRARIAASLLELPVEVGTGGAVVGQVRRRHLGVSGGVAEGSAVAGTGEEAAHGFGG